jgi:lipoate-protein ligase A
LCHGTLLIDADLQEVQRLTKPRGTRISQRYPRSRFAKVANCGIEKSAFVTKLSESGMDFKAGELSPVEKENLSRLEGKYRSDDWNLGDPFGRKDF